MDKLTKSEIELLEIAFDSFIDKQSNVVFAIKKLFDESMVDWKGLPNPELENEERELSSAKKLRDKMLKEENNNHEEITKSILEQPIFCFKSVKKELTFPVTKKTIKTLYSAGYCSHFSRCDDWKECFKSYKSYGVKSITFYSEDV